MWLLTRGEQRYVLHGSHAAINDHAAASLALDKAYTALALARFGLKVPESARCLAPGKVLDHLGNDPFPQLRGLEPALMWLARRWVGVNNLILSSLHRTEWVIRGVDLLEPRSWYLVSSNHQSWADILALQRAFHRKIPFLKFFIKQELVWFPFLGIAWWALDMPFMKRYSARYLARKKE